MVTKKAIKWFLLEFNSWSMRFMFAYISLGRGGLAAGVRWGKAQHCNGTCAHKVITYHPRQAQKCPSCSGTAARSGVGLLQGASRLGRINDRITLFSLLGATAASDMPLSSPTPAPLRDNRQIWLQLAGELTETWTPVDWVCAAAACQGWSTDHVSHACEACSKMEPSGMGEREVPPEPSYLLLLKDPQKSSVWMEPLRVLIRQHAWRINCLLRMGLTIVCSVVAFSFCVTSVILIHKNN